MCLGQSLMGSPEGCGPLAHSSGRVTQAPPRSCRTLLPLGGPTVVGPGPSPGLQGCPAAMRAGGSCGEVVPPPAECPVPLLQSHGYQEDQGPSSQRAGVGGRRCPFLRRTHDRRLCLTAVGTDGWLRFPCGSPAADFALWPQWPGRGVSLGPPSWPSASQRPSVVTP